MSDVDWEKRALEAEARVESLERRIQEVKDAAGVIGAENEVLRARVAELEEELKNRRSRWRR